MDSDTNIDQLMCEYDETSIPIPDIEFQPHRLISKAVLFSSLLNIIKVLEHSQDQYAAELLTKHRHLDSYVTKIIRSTDIGENIRSAIEKKIEIVRKQYMDYIIKTLCLNYETNQRLLNKNIYLPSAIWRCAKYIEMKAAQTSMVVPLYRRNVIDAIKSLKKDTTKGKLNKQLYECLRKPPDNEKKIQTMPTRQSECTCQCKCNQVKRRRISESPIGLQNKMLPLDTARSTLNTSKEQYVIPVIENLQTDSPKLASINGGTSIHQEQTSIASKLLNETNGASPKPPTRLSVESRDDELTLQLEKLFYGDSINDDDDLFEGTLYDTYDFSVHEDAKKTNVVQEPLKEIAIVEKQDAAIENHATAIMKSLDERLASLAGLLGTNTDNSVTQQKPTKEKRKSTKWLCEDYFLKMRLHEVLDQIRDNNRKKLLRIKQLFLDLFGDDNDDEDLMSPLEETPDFIISCKERIAPWVVKLLTPFYIQGRIKGKILFKSLAKHLIRLIYQCSHYPSEYEVRHFVSDFLENHKMIRCEADFKQFRIENI